MHDHPPPVTVRRLPSGERVLVDHLLPGDPRQAQSEWKRARMRGRIARFKSCEAAKHTAVRDPGFATQWLLELVARVQDAHHRDALISPGLIEQMQAVREILGRRFAGLEHEIRKVINSVDSSWRRDGRSVSPLVARPRTRCARTRVRHREQRPASTRRASASSSTSSADPGDDDGEPEPPPALPAWHPRWGTCSANLIALLDAEAIR